MTDFPLLRPALPELFLAIAGMALLLYGVFRGDKAMRTVAWLTVFSLVIALLLFAKV